MMVKICGITNLSDALAAVDAGASALGFNFWPGSPRYIPAQSAAAIIGQLPSQVITVGVFVDSVSLDDAKAAGVQIVQVHGELASPPEFAWWQAWPATLPSLGARMAASKAQSFLIDAPAGAERGGTGKTYDWKLAAHLPGRVILAGGLSDQNVAFAIETARPWGVDACSRLESEPGKKDHQKMRSFLRAALSTK